MSIYQYLHVIGLFESLYIDADEDKRVPSLDIHILDPVIRRISLTEIPDVPINGTM